MALPLLVVWSTSPAAAVEPRLYLEPAVGLWLDDPHADAFASGLYLAVRPALSLGPALDLQLSYVVLYTPATYDHSTDQTAHLLYGGLRVRPFAAARGDLGGPFFDANAGYARVAESDTFGFDFGLGYDFLLSPQLSLGVVVRYGHLLRPEGSSVIQSDGQYLTIGMGFGLGPNHFRE
jgi:hypothetical protein